MLVGLFRLSATAVEPVTTTGQQSREEGEGVDHPDRSATQSMVKFTIT